MFEWFEYSKSSNKEVYAELRSGRARDNLPKLWELHEIAFTLMVWREQPSLPKKRRLLPTPAPTFRTFTAGISTALQSSVGFAFLYNTNSTVKAIAHHLSHTHTHSSGVVDRPCHRQSQPSHPRSTMYGCPCKIHGASLSLVHLMPDCLHFAYCFTITRFICFNNRCVAICFCVFGRAVLTHEINSKDQDGRKNEADMSALPHSIVLIRLSSRARLRNNCNILGL